MCLAVPAQLIEREGDVGVADLHGNRVPVNTMLVPEADVGQWVLIHAGFAIQRLDADAAEQTWAVLDDLQQHTAGSASPLRGEQPDRQAAPGTSTRSGFQESMP